MLHHIRTHLYYFYKTFVLRRIKNMFLLAFEYIFIFIDYLNIHLLELLVQVYWPIVFWIAFFL